VLDDIEPARKRNRRSVGVGHAKECASIDRTASTQRNRQTANRKPTLPLTLAPCPVATESLCGVALTLALGHYRAQEG